MGMNFGNITKASFQTDIKRKQAFFNRCKRRFKVASTPGEKQFLKGEAGKIVTELKQCCTKWKNFGFGGFSWITKSFTVTNFNAARKSTTRSNSARKTYGSRTSSRRTAGRSSSSRRTVGSRTRSNASRRTYVAW